MSEEVKEYKNKAWYLSKTTWVTVAAIVFFVLKFFGIVEEIPAGFDVGVAVAAVLNILLKVVTWIFYKIKAKNEDAETDED